MVILYIYNSVTIIIIKIKYIYINTTYIVSTRFIIIEPNKNGLCRVYSTEIIRGARCLKIPVTGQKGNQLSTIKVMERAIDTENLENIII